MILRLKSRLYQDVTLYLQSHCYEYGVDYQIITSVALESFFIHFLNECCYKQFMIEFENQL